MFREIKIFFIVFLIFLALNNVYSADNNIKASYFKDKVDALAKTTDSTAVLLFIESDSVTIDGTSPYWNYIYAALDSIKLYYFRTTINFVSFDSISYDMLVGAAGLSRRWIDSDSAMVLAELHGGSDFRDLNPNCRITAMLSKGTVFPPPEWFIRYISNEDPNNKKLIIIDATFKPTSALGLKDNVNPPDNFVLYQNFPNPFNPLTVIKFKLLKSCKVILKIYNLSGQEIVTLINDFKPKGTYEFTWQPDGLPSGIYLYTLKAGNFIETRKLVLQK